MALVHDLSVTGARIETQSARFEAGDIVQLSLPFLPMERQAEIAWTEGASAGVRFYASLDAETFRFLSHALRRPDPAEALRATLAPLTDPTPEITSARRSERAEVAIAANCRTENGQRVFVAMIDLTPEGCCLFRRDISLAAGQKLSLQPECLAAMRASVQWSQGSLAGVLFENPLYPAMFEHLAQTFPWPLSEPAKLALAPHAQISEAVQRELTRMIARAEGAFRNRAAPKDVLTTRPPIVGSRPGIAARAPDSKLARLFLG